MILALDSNSTVLSETDFIDALRSQHGFAPYGVTLLMGSFEELAERAMLISEGDRHAREQNLHLLEELGLADSPYIAVTPVGQSDPLRPLLADVASPGGDMPMIDGQYELPEGCTFRFDPDGRVLAIAFPGS